MDLKSLFKRLSPRASAASGDAVQQARTRARRRLMGAAVLLVVGVIAFPLLFETKPRPLPMDTPMGLAQKAGAAESVVPALPANVASMPMPASSVASTSSTTGTSASSPAVGAPAAAVTTAAVAAVATAAVATSAAPAASGNKAASPASAPTSAPTSAHISAPSSPPASAAGALKTAASQPAAQASAEAPVKTPAKPEPKAQAKAEPKADAKAEAKADAKAARFTVQVGAFADAAATREARSKAEKLGLKTYTQEVDTSAGKRTRVRVGPFKTREEAQQAAAKLRAANLPASVLTL